MAFENLKNDAEQIQIGIKEIVDTNVAYYKLWFFKVTMKSMTTISKMFLIAAFLIFAVLFISVSFALFLGDLFHSYFLGFLIVGAFYLVMCVLVFFAKSKGIEKLILEKFSEFFFND